MESNQINKNGKIRLALIQDSLLIKGGSERIFQYLVEEFSGADIFTLAYNPECTWPNFKKYRIITSFANRYIQSHFRFKIFFPVLIHIYKRWNLSGYDIILSSSATVAKYISRFNGTHICYCYYPTRAIWNPEAYFRETSLKKILFYWFLPYFKRKDLEAARRVDKFIAISKYSQQAIKDIYNREADVIFCPIDYEHFSKGLEVEKKNHYLIVSRLESWKCLDYAIEAFNRSGRSLKIIGSGEKSELLKALARDNIQFMGNVDDDTLVQEYGNARAVIFTPALEYGLIPLEANAAGTPVIALGKGGVKETMIGLDSLKISTQEPTAVFYNESSPEELNAAIKDFESRSFNRDALSKHAKEFSINKFKLKIRNYLEESFANKQQL